MDQAEKRCTKCGEVKAVSEFPIRIDRGRQPRSHCRPCHNAAAKTPHAKAVQRDANLRRKYGISAAQFDAMLLAQGGMCPISGTSLTAENAHVDHDHATGAVRAILCELCNKGLGQFKDDPKRLRAALQYLLAHSLRAVG